MDDPKLLFTVASAIISVAGSFYAMRTQIVDVRSQVKAHDDDLRGRDGISFRLARLESDQTSHAGKLDETVRRLESVTEQLQRLMIDIARGQRPENHA